MPLTEGERIITEERNPRVIPLHPEGLSLARYTSDMHPVFESLPQTTPHLLSAEWTIYRIEVVGGDAPPVYRKVVAPMNKQESRENSYLGRLARKIVNVSKLLFTKKDLAISAS